jgi:hypothetical protein
MSEEIVPQIIYRYAPPNRYDQAPFGTLCKVAVEPNKQLLYIQNSNDAENPKWEIIDS